MISTRAKSLLRCIHFKHLDAQQQEKFTSCEIWSNRSISHLLFAAPCNMKNLYEMDEKSDPKKPDQVGEG